MLELLEEEVYRCLFFGGPNGHLGFAVVWPFCLVLDTVVVATPDSECSIGPWRDELGFWDMTGWAVWTVSAMDWIQDRCPWSSANVDQYGAVIVSDNGCHLYGNVNLEDGGMNLCVSCDV